MTVQHEFPSGGWTPEGDEEERRRPAWMPPTGVLVVIGLVFVLALVYLVVHHGSSTKAGSQASQTPSTSTTGSPSGLSLPIDTKVTAGGGGSSSISGVPIKYPQTESGAVEAAINYDMANSSSAALVDSTGPAMQQYYLAPAAVAQYGMTQQQRTDAQKFYGINAQAQPVDSNGAPVAGEMFISGTLPQYGAFRVTASTTTDVTVEVWAPFYHGVVPSFDGITSGGEFGVGWTTDTVSVMWLDGDWRVTKIDSTEGPFPTPKNAVTLSYALRAQMRPARDGWRMVANATQGNEAIPAGAPVVQVTPR